MKIPINHHSKAIFAVNLSSVNNINVYCSKIYVKLLILIRIIVCNQKMLEFLLMPLKIYLY